MSENTLIKSESLNNALQHPFLLGDWHVEPALNRLSSASGARCQRSLEPRLMHLLCFLAANSGQVLTREQLNSELWPQVVVTDNSLTRAVSELRKQLQLPLQEHDAHKDYLQTVPKRGYRLRLPVRKVMQAGDHQSPGWMPGIPLMRHLTAPGIRKVPTVLAACLVSAWLSFTLWVPSHESASGSPIADSSQYGDRVIDQQQPIHGGQFSLSSLDSFARQPTTVLTALLASPGQGTDLVMLDIDTLALRVLIDNTPEPADHGAAV